MPLNETVTLNITEAQRQISVLEGQLDQLSQPITVPVNVSGSGDLEAVRRDLSTSEDAVAELNRELEQTDDALRSVGTEAKRSGDDIDRTATRGKSAFDGLGKSILGLASAFGAIALARGAFSFLSESITSASNLEQSLGALDAVFGDLSDEVVTFGETADQSVGLAASQFNQLASVLGSQLQTFGFNVRDAATETQNLIVLASDLAATFGGPVSQAVEAISSLLRGEVNPIERYGVAMNEAAVQSRALEDGLAATANELTFQDKTMARLAILYEQTANSQGQFARESETTAGMLERLNAQFENARAAVGEALVPAFQVLLDIAPSVVSMIETSLVPALAGLAAGFENVDAGSFIATLSGVPFAVEATISQIGAGTQIFGNTLQLFNDLATLNFSGVSEQFQQLGDDIQRFSEIPIANQAIQNMIATLAAGADPASALAEVLNQLGQEVSALDPETFEELAVQLVAMADAAGADPGDIERIIDNVKRFGEEAGFSAIGIEILVEALRDLLIRDAAARSPEDLERVGRFIEFAGTAAGKAAPTIEELGESLGFTRRELEGFGDIGQIDFDNIFDQLPNELDAAAAAMKTTEGEIETDFSDFLDNLVEELEAQRQFNENIETLFDLGFERLAQAFTDAGIESAGLLADGLTDPTELARAEQELDEAARALAVSEVDAFAESVQGQLDGVNLTPIPVKIIPDFSDFVIPGSTLQGVGSTGTSDIVGGSVVVDIDITNEGFNPSTVDQAKQASIIQSVVSGQIG